MSATTTASSSTRAIFTRMQDSTQADWMGLIVPEAMKMAKSLPDRVLEHLKLLDGDFGGSVACEHGHGHNRVYRRHDGLPADGTTSEI